MPINVNNPAVDKPSRQFVAIVGVGISDAIHAREDGLARPTGAADRNGSGETTRPD